ncbi:uncharacterized protein LOC142621210 [Castanea sativa]|uniref:uncharacterized protein LOC142621210 n=1 Tax=Castanea sativa TaxID=21020 RepID=UPI003F64FBEE
MTSDSSSTPSSSSAPTASVDMANESANNPFFLPANENPGLILTSQPLTSLENYMTWARSVFLALSSRNKFGFVNGSISEPDSTSPLFNSWNRCNTMILSWLTNSLSPDLKASVIYINSAKDLWIDLKNRLSQDNTPRLFELQKEISHLVQGSMSVSSYFSKFKTLWDEFVNNQPFTVCNFPCACGSKTSQLDAQHKEHVFRFLMGLNDSYGTLIGQILLVEPFPPLSKVCSLILQEEKRRSIGNTVNVVQQIQQLDPVAMHVNGPRSFQGTQSYARNNGGKGNSKKERSVCTYCGFTGHVADKCYKLYGYLPGYKPKGGAKAMANQITGGFGFDGFGFGTPTGLSAQTASQVASVMAPILPCPSVASASSSSSNFLGNPFWIPPNFTHSIFSAQVIDWQCFKSNRWIIDTGATNHMVHSVSQLTTITSAVHSYVYLPNGDKAIDLAQWSMIGLGKESNGLYLLQAAVSSINAAALATTASHITSSDLWHKFAPRARKCVFLGYPHGIKGYKVLDLQSNSVYVSRDIVFYETIFPNAKCSPSSTSLLDTFVFPHVSIFDITSDIVLCPPSSSPPDLNHVNPISSPASASVESLSADSISDLIVPPASQTSSVPCSTINPTPLRRSSRSHKPPSYLSEYSCQFASTKPSSGVPYVLSDHLTYFHLGPSFHSFVMAVSSNSSELVSFQQAIQFSEWRAAMDKEIEDLEVNDTWTLTSLPPGKSAIGCKWVYRVKYLPDGTIERYKARLVAKGFT